MENVFFKDIETVSKMLRNQEITPVELTKQLLERIQSVDSVLNAYITLMSEEALTQAAVLEKELKEGNIRGPLHGVPIAIKDIFETKGSVTTSGSKIFEKFVSHHDAEIVTLLKKAGAIIIGKTNLHEFAMGATTENPHYGPSRNPWNIMKIPGGSSGGSAVAVAAGMAFGAVGTDTGGSIRLPAALCGVVGLKPTYDLISTAGCTPLSKSLDHIGPMTRTVADSRTLLRVCADAEKLKQVDLSTRLGDLKGIKVAVCKEYFFEGMDEEIAMHIHQALAKLESLGAEIIEVDIVGISEAIEAQKMIFKAEAYAFHESMFLDKPHLYGEDVQFRLQAGKGVLASEYIQAKQYQQAFQQHIRFKMIEEHIDVFFSPTNVIPPFDIGSVGPEQSVNNIFRLGKTPLGNLLGLPILTIPCGFTSERLPIGFQIMGRVYEEGKVLAIGEVYEQSENWVAYLEKNEVFQVEKTI
ncbi:amidase [Cytobacillus sp. FSL K6-0265]|uniref:amidase n=1 Tax=Cytobacillus sp. FSL K6-0265 TaxID=2921448 RepID=UPI0030F7AF5B